MLQIQRQIQESAADLNWYEHPERHCDRPELRSQGAINWLNSKVGKPDGPPGRVVGFDGPMVPVGEQRDPHQSNCHVTLALADGHREAGTMHTDDHPPYENSLNVTWTSDAQATANAPVRQSAAAMCVQAQRNYEVCFKDAVAAYWDSTHKHEEAANRITDPYQRRAFERATGLYKYTPEEVAQSRCGHITEMMWQMGCPDH